MITFTDKSGTCPSPDSVRRYLEGWADESSSLAIEEHLTACHSCSTLLEDENSPSDHWIQSIRSLPKSTSIEESNRVPVESREPIAPEVQRAMERCKEISSRETANSNDSPDFYHASPNALLGDIGPYALIRSIGQGGMGYVMLARHKHLNKEVAVKILPRTPWRIPTEEARFQREVRAVGKLEHPAIVTALDAGEWQGTHFLAMEYVDGLDLSRLTKAIGRLAIPDACELIRQTAIGLSYAHAQGVVHRDIKPSNLMLDRTGKIKILDFGLAQLQPWDDGCADLTSVGQLMGTLDYMAPEQAEHGGAVSYRADLYSLGATLFRLLVGRAPLAITPTQTPIEKLRLLSSHPIPHLKTMLPEAPNELCSIVDGLLARDPSQRPPSAAHLAESLEPLAKGSTLVELLKKAQSVHLETPESELSPSHLLASNRIAISSEVANNANTQDRGVTKNQVSRGGRGWTPWIAAGLLTPLLALGGFLLYLETQKGQIVVESEVAGVRLRVVSDEKEIDDLQLSQGANSIRLRAGKYELLIDSPTDSIILSDQSFVLKKGETIVARITKGGDAKIKDSSQTAKVLAKDLPLYDGKSLSEWLGLLEVERSPDRVREALTAVDALASPSEREQVRNPIHQVIQRNMDNEILFQALAIDKKTATSSEFLDKFRSVLLAMDEEVRANYFQQGAFHQLLQDDRRLAEMIDIIFKFERTSANQDYWQKKASEFLAGLLSERTDLNLDELRRYCNRLFETDYGRKEILQKEVKSDEARQELTQRFVGLLGSKDAKPDEQADAMIYFLNPKSLAKSRNDVIASLDKILNGMTRESETRYAITRWPIQRIPRKGDEMAGNFESMFGPIPRTNQAPSWGGRIDPTVEVPYCIFVIRFIAATGLSNELSKPLQDLAKSCMQSIQPVAPELLMLRIQEIDLRLSQTKPAIYSLGKESTEWKSDFFAFHATLRLLRSMKLAELHDFLPENESEIDEDQWRSTSTMFSQLDTDRGGDLDSKECPQIQKEDFLVMDRDKNGYVTEIEHYRYRTERK